MADNVKTKDPGATLQYGFNWGDWLADGDSIDTYTITISPSGTLTNEADTTTSGCVLVKLSGGTSGTRYAVTCRIITSSGSEVDERTMKIDVTNR